MLNSQPLGFYPVNTGRLQRSEGDQPTAYVIGIAPLSGTDRDHSSGSHDFH